MKDIKQPLPTHIQQIIDQLDGQIAQYKELIERLEFTKKMWIQHQPVESNIIMTNAPLTRETIRNFMKMYSQPTQTVKVIDILYPKKSEEEKGKLVKTLSVIFNQMAKEGEITIERKEGIKGNFYKWKK